jgi:hypothetical protein
MGNADSGQVHRKLPMTPEFMEEGMRGWRQRGQLLFS